MSIRRGSCNKYNVSVPKGHRRWPRSRRVVSSIALVMFLGQCIWPFVYLHTDRIVSIDDQDVAGGFVLLPPKKAAAAAAAASSETVKKPKRVSNATAAEVAVDSRGSRSKNNNRTDALRTRAMQRPGIPRKKTAATAPNPKPWFVLHIGPQKTATTTIQYGLEQNSLLLAQEDSYYFLGQVMSRSRKPLPSGESPFHVRLLLNHLVNPVDRDTEAGRKLRERAAASDSTNIHEHFDEFQQRLEWHRARGNHVVLSSELIGSQLRTEYPHIWNGLKDVLSGFRVRVVVTYRHWFDWLPSNYYQQTMGNDREFPSLLDWIDDHLKYRSPQPSLANKTLDVGTDSKGNARLNSAIDSQAHLSLWLYEKWSHHFDDVRIFDMHQDGYLGNTNRGTADASIRSNKDDLLAAFVCQMMPAADRSCRILRERQKQTKHADARNDEGNIPSKPKSRDPKDTTAGKKRGKLRPSGDLYPQRIAEVAIERGLLQPEHFQKMKRRNSLRKLRSLLKQQMVLSSSSFQAPPPKQYFDCLSPALEERLFETSLRFMERVYKSGAAELKGAQQGTLSDAEWEDARAKHNQLFKENKNKGKFCDVNPERILDDPRLKAVISGLCFSNCTS